MSKLTMKKYFLLPLIAALALGIACQKQPTEEERRAEVERQVQERLAAERQTAEQERLAQQKAELDAREKALAAKEAATAAPPAEEPPVTSTEETTSETSETRSETVSAESYGTFYEKLEPYGAWRETADYGYVWQPREAEESRDWRPYTEGRWAYSDAGWTWVSDESFGWATYHYGRWLRLRRVGWVWVPGNEWAPAWVSWRTSKDYVGWAPLPPEARFDRRHGIHNWADSYYDIGPDQYAFVRGEEFGAPHVRRSLVSAQLNITIVNETVNVTNITFSNTMIINQGPNYDEIRARSRQPMERYRLRRHSEMNTELRSATVRGDEIDVAEPQFRNVPGFRRPRSIKERVTDAAVDNGWTAVSDRSTAERTRAKMRSEATPPPNAPPKKFVKPADAGNAPAVSATAAPTATPAVAATAAATVTPAPIATIAPTARPSATIAPTASPTPRVRQSPSITPRATLAPVASPSPTPVVAPTATPAIPLPSPSAAVLPVVKPSPPVSLRASPSVAPLTDPAAAEKADKKRRLEELQKNRQLPNKPAPAASIPPLPPAVEHTPPVQPPRKSPPVLLNTPPPVTASSPPPVTPPTAAPRIKPAITPSASETAPVAPNIPTVPPKRIPPRAAPPVLNTPPPDTAPSAPPPAPPRNDARAKEKKPKPPGPFDAAIVTPTPVPPAVPK